MTRPSGRPWRRPSGCSCLAASCAAFAPAALSAFARALAVGLVGLRVPCGRPCVGLRVRSALAVGLARPVGLRPWPRPVGLAVPWRRPSGLLAPGRRRLVGRLAGLRPRRSRRAGPAAFAAACGFSRARGRRRAGSAALSSDFVSEPRSPLRRRTTPTGRAVSCVGHGDDDVVRDRAAAASGRRDGRSAPGRRSGLRRRRDTPSTAVDAARRDDHPDDAHMHRLTTARGPHWPWSRRLNPTGNLHPDMSDETSRPRAMTPMSQADFFFFASDSRRISVGATSSSTVSRVTMTLATSPREGTSYIT